MSIKQNIKSKQHSVARITTNINPLLEEEVRKRKAKNALATTTDIVYQLLGERIAEIREQENRKREARLQTVQEIHDILDSYAVKDEIKKMNEQEFDDFLESNF
jgi:hypothetical protein